MDKLKEDLAKMADRDALFDELVAGLEFCSRSHLPHAKRAVLARSLLSRAKALQK